MPPGLRLRARLFAFGVLTAVPMVAACGGGPSTPTVERRLGGETRSGSWVSPFAYESFVRAELAEARGDLQVAAAELENALTSVDDDPFLLALLADLYDRLGRREAADTALAQGREAAPCSEAIELTRARIAERHGEVDAALETYRALEECEPDLGRAPLARAALLRAQGRTVEAEAVLRDFLARAPHAANEVSRVELSLALERGDASSALRALSRLTRARSVERAEIERVANGLLAGPRRAAALSALSSLPRAARSPSLYARALIAAGDYDEAEAVITASTERELGGRLAQAQLLRSAHRRERAAELLARAPAPTDREASILAAELTLELGDPARAAALLTELGARSDARVLDGIRRSLRAAGLSELAEEILDARVEGDGDLVE